MGSSEQMGRSTQVIQLSFKVYTIDKVYKSFPNHYWDPLVNFTMFCKS